MFFVICLLMIKAVETSSSNLAVGKSVKICEGKVASGETTDGNKHKLAETIVDICPAQTITVDLGQYYYVHSVIVYGGQKMENDKILFGATFSVFMINGDPIECGMYLKRERTTFHGMRVNCASVEYAVSLICVSIKTFPFYLAEIEVYSLASGNPYKSPMIHIGCFSRLSSVIETSAINFDGCRVFCSSNDYLLAALKERRCYCARAFDHSSEEPPQYCNTTCVSSNEHCGGFGLYSTYLLQIRLPHLKGCLNKDSLSLEMKERNNIDVVKCLQLCDQSQFALIKNGVYCACSNDSLESAGENIELCNVPCSDDRNSYCGGTDHWSLYGTCFNNEISTLPCSKLFHCARSWDEYGVCKGGCESGYVGEHCIEREKSSDENLCRYFNPCKNRSNTACHYFKKTKTFHCYCKDGYWRESVECEDIDECSYEACDNKTSACENLFGSFVCLCHYGYFQITRDVCITNTTVDYYPRVFDMEILAVFSALSFALSAILLSYGRKIDRSEGQSEIGVS